MLMSAIGKPLATTKINNSGMRTHKPPVGNTDKEQVSAQSLDVFERLFRSATQQKARLIVRVKENIAKKTKEIQASSPQMRRLQEKAGNILKENKRLVNNTRSEEQDSPHDMVSHETVVVF